MMEGQQKGWGMVVAGETELLVELWVSILIFLSPISILILVQETLWVCQLLLWLILFYLQCSVDSVTHFFL